MSCACVHLGMSIYFRFHDLLRTEKPNAPLHGRQILFGTAKMAFPCLGNRSYKPGLGFSEVRLHSSSKSEFNNKDIALDRTRNYFQPAEVFTLQRVAKA